MIWLARGNTEIDNLESAKQPLHSVSLDGIVTGLSAVKKGKNSSFLMEASVMARQR